MNLLQQLQCAEDKNTASVGGEQVEKKYFAYTPTDKPSTWKLPCKDAAHTRNALARFNQADIPESAKAGVLAFIKRRAKHFGIEVGDEKAS